MCFQGTIFFLLVVTSAVFIFIEEYRQILRRLADRKDEIGEIAQLYKEWTSEPYIDIVSVKAGEECPDTHPDVFLYETWPGTALTCYCRKSREAFVN